METWWVVLALLVLVAFGVLYLVRRRSRGMEHGDATTATADRDFVGERETSRIADMSAEDQAWQAASLKKDRANQDRTPPAS